MLLEMKSWQIQLKTREKEKKCKNKQESVQCIEIKEKKIGYLCTPVVDSC